jgi:regulator of PEP synthase PpsR (kinase-PPPase family)
MIAVLENIERVLKSKRKDKHARYVALDIVRQEMRKMKGTNTPGTVPTHPYAMFVGNKQIVDINRLPLAARQRIVELCMRRQKIPAIKEVRMAAMVGLKEAKETVELHPALAGLKL